MGRVRSLVDSAGRGAVPVPCRAVVDMLAKNGERSSSSLRLHLPRTQSNVCKPFLTSYLYLPSTPHRGSLISPQTDQNPIAA